MVLSLDVPVGRTLPGSDASRFQPSSQKRGIFAPVVIDLCGLDRPHQKEERGKKKNGPTSYKTGWGTADGCV